MVAITVGSLLAAGLAWQVWRAKPGFTGEETQAGAQATSEKSEKYLGRVNGQLIGWDEVAQECMDRYGAEVLNNVINRTLIQQACAERRVEVTGAEVNQEIVRIAQRFGLDRATWFKMIEAERGLTPVQYQRDVIWPMLSLKKLAGPTIDITNEQLRNAYEDAYGEKVNARMIMADNLRHAQQLWEEVSRNPDEFERIAREKSVEPNSRTLGGAIPPLRRHTGNEALRTAAFKLKTPGEISGIVQVDASRYAILKYEGRTERVDHDFETVKTQLHEDLLEQEVQRIVATTFKNLKEDARVDNYISGESNKPIKQVSADSYGRPEAGPAGRERTTRPTAGAPRPANARTATSPQRRTTR